MYNSRSRKSGNGLYEVHTKNSYQKNIYLNQKNIVLNQKKYSFKLEKYSFKLEKCSFNKLCMTGL